MKTSAERKKDTGKIPDDRRPSSYRWDRWGRRTFLAAAAASVPVLGREYGPSAQPVRYPDPDIVVLDQRFVRYKLGNTPIQRLYTGYPLGGRTRLERSGALPGLERHSQRPPTALAGRGRTRERPSVPPRETATGIRSTTRGRQISCEHGTRRVVRYEPDGTATVLAGEWEGKPLNRSQRRGGASGRRRHLVHRSGIRKPHETTRGTRERSTSRKPSTGSTPRAAGWTR